MQRGKTSCPIVEIRLRGTFGIRDGCRFWGFCRGLKPVHPVVSVLLSDRRGCSYARQDERVDRIVPAVCCQLESIPRSDEVFRVDICLQSCSEEPTTEGLPMQIPTAIRPIGSGRSKCMKPSPGLSIQSLIRPTFSSPSFVRFKPECLPVVSYDFALRSHYHG